MSRLERMKQYYSSIESMDSDLRHDLPWLLEQAEEKECWKEKAERYERALKEIREEGTFGTDIVTKEVYRHSGAQNAYEALEEQE